MSDNKVSLNDLDELTLLAVGRLGDQAYGVPIFDMLEHAGRPTSIGAIYATLDRLESKGLVKSRQGEATAERGGRAKKYFEITGAGNKALDDAEHMRKLLRGELKTGLLSIGGAI